MRQTIGSIRQNPRTRPFLLDLMREVVDLGRSRGVDLSVDYAADRLDFCDSLPASMTSSMHADLERGNRLELPWLSGGVVRLERITISGRRSIAQSQTFLNHSFSVPPKGSDRNVSGQTEEAIRSEPSPNVIPRTRHRPHRSGGRFARESAFMRISQNAWPPNSYSSVDRSVQDHRRRRGQYERHIDGKISRFAPCRSSYL